VAPFAMNLGSGGYLLDAGVNQKRRSNQKSATPVSLSIFRLGRAVISEVTWNARLACRWLSRGSQEASWSSHTTLGGRQQAL
jgi:hypothetical protein